MSNWLELLETIVKFYISEDSTVNIRSLCIKNIYKFYKDNYTLYDDIIIPLISPVFKCLKNPELDAENFKITFHVLIDIWKLSKSQEGVLLVLICNEILSCETIQRERQLEVLSGLISLISTQFDVLHPSHINSIYVTLSNLLVQEKQQRKILYLIISFCSTISCDYQYYVQVYYDGFYKVNKHLTCNSNYAISNLMYYFDVSLLINGLRDCCKMTTDYQTYLYCIEALIILSKSPAFWEDYNVGEIIGYLCGIIKDYYRKKILKLYKCSTKFSIDDENFYKCIPTTMLDDIDKSYLYYRLEVLFCNLICFIDKIPKSYYEYISEIVSLILENTIYHLIKRKEVLSSESSASVESALELRKRSSSLSSFYRKSLKSPDINESMDLLLPLDYSSNYPTDGERTAELIRLLLLSTSVMCAHTKEMKKSLTKCFILLKKYMLSCNNIDGDLIFFVPIIRLYQNIQSYQNFEVNEDIMPLINAILSGVVEILSNTKLSSLLSEYCIDYELIELYINYYFLCPLKIRESKNYNLLSIMKKYVSNNSLHILSEEYLKDSMISINYLYYKNFDFDYLKPEKYYITPNSIFSIYTISNELKAIICRKIWTYSIYYLHIPNLNTQYNFYNSLFSTSVLKYNLNPGSINLELTPKYENNIKPKEVNKPKENNDIIEIHVKKLSSKDILYKSTLNYDTTSNIDESLKKHVTKSVKNFTEENSQVLTSINEDSLSESDSKKSFPIKTPSVVPHLSKSHLTTPKPTHYHSPDMPEKKTNYINLVQASPLRVEPIQTNNDELSPLLLSSSPPISTRKNEKTLVYNFSELSKSDSNCSINPGTIFNSVFIQPNPNLPPRIKKISRKNSYNEEDVYSFRNTKFNLKSHPKSMNDLSSVNIDKTIPEKTKKFTIEPPEHFYNLTQTRSRSSSNYKNTPQIQNITSPTFLAENLETLTINENPVFVSDSKLPLLDPFYKINESAPGIVTVLSNDQLKKETEEIDFFIPSYIHAISIVYIKKNQPINKNILLNNTSSITFEMFLTKIGDCLSLNNIDEREFYIGNLKPNDIYGDKFLIYRDSIQVVFYVNTLLNSGKNDNTRNVDNYLKLMNTTRVMIVYCEDNVEVSELEKIFDNIEVFIIVNSEIPKYLVVKVQSNQDLLPFGPLLYGTTILPSITGPLLIRQTSINANRLCSRNDNKYYYSSVYERAKRIRDIYKNYS